VAVHAQAGGGLVEQLHPGAAQRGAQGHGHLVHHLVQLEAAALVAGLVDRQLLEAAQQLGRPLQVALQHLRNLGQPRQEGRERRAAQALGHALFKRLLAAGQGAGHHHGIADGRVELVRQAGHQRAQRGQLLRAHQLFLRPLQALQRGLQLVGAVLHAQLQRGVQVVQLGLDAAALGHVLGTDDQALADARAAEVDDAVAPVLAVHLEFGAL
jgi:hypothetical protein